jgi:molybdopterin biosynthesis enzyme
MPQRITLLTPLDDVLARIAGCVNPIGAQWIDDLASALGRIVAEDIRAEMPLPPRPIALRDGWALSSPLTMDAGPYAPAHVRAAIRLDVGEMLPTDADSVAPLDAVLPGDGEAQVVSPVTFGEGVLPAGGDALEGVARSFGRGRNSMRLASRCSQHSISGKQKFAYRASASLVLTLRRTACSIL